MSHTYVSSQTDRWGSLGEIFKILSFSLVFSFLGAVVGALFVPVTLVPLFIVVELIMIIAAVVIRMRQKRIGLTFLFSFTAVSGVTLYPVVLYYASTLGAQLVAVAFATTAIVFGVLAVYAYQSSRDFSYLGGFLFGGTIALVVIGLVGLFFPFAGSFMDYIYTFGGVLIFIGWILYDISNIRHGVAQDDVPLVVLNLYLDLVNLFLFILRLLALLTGRRD